MKKVFVTLIALTIILSLSFFSLTAQEPGERSGEARERKLEERREAEPSEKKVDLHRRMEQEERVREMREMPERLFHKLFEELERQRREIHALREEIAALRKMLEDQYASRRFQRGRRRRTWSRRWESRREPERGPSPGRREPERRDIRRAPDIHGQIRELEAGVEQRPDDIELRMRLAHAYREVDRIEAAIVQYKAALEIDPGFDPPYRALEELGYKFPHEFREREEPLEDSAGEVISANEEEVKLKTLEGDTVTFRVPSRQREDGSWVLNEDFSEFAKSLEPGTRVKILWRESEGHRIIHRMERVKESD